MDSFKFRQQNSRGCVLDQPQYIGEYCVNAQRGIILGRSQARYLCNFRINRECHMDLNEGYEIFDAKIEPSNEKIDILLKWLMLHSLPGDSLKKVCHDADFVSWRGIFARIAATPSNKDEHWMFAVVCYKSVIFLCEYPTEQKLTMLANMSNRDKIMAYWGFKFEQFMTSSHPESVPDTKKPVTNKEEFHIMVKSKFNESHLKILYSAETDGLYYDPYTASGAYVELKTMRFDGQKKHSWDRKALKWFLQSYLTATKEIVVGLRDDSGIVINTKRISVGSLPCNRSWKVSEVICYLQQLLLWIKGSLYSVPELTYFMVEYKGTSPTIRKLLSTEEKFTFLPDFFMDHFN